MPVRLQLYYAQWNDQLFSHPLWQSLGRGSAGKSVVDGWLIETYHFIRGANARLAYAIAHTGDLRIREIFTHHYIEEWDHYAFFAEALRGGRYRRSTSSNWARWSARAP